MKVYQYHRSCYNGHWSMSIGESITYFPEFKACLYFNNKKECGISKLGWLLIEAEDYINDIKSKKIPRRKNLTNNAIDNLSVEDTYSFVSSQQKIKKEKGKVIITNKLTNMDDLVYEKNEYVKIVLHQRGDSLQICNFKEIEIDITLQELLKFETLQENVKKQEEILKTSKQKIEYCYNNIFVTEKRKILIEKYETQPN